MNRATLRKMVAIGIDEASRSWVCAGATLKKIGPDILRALDRLDELERLHAGPPTTESPRVE